MNSTSSEKWVSLALLIASALVRKKKTCWWPDCCRSSAMEALVACSASERYIHVSSLAVPYNNADVATLELKHRVQNDVKILVHTTNSVQNTPASFNGNLMQAYFRIFFNLSFKDCQVTRFNLFQRKLVTRFPIYSYTNLIHPWILVLHNEWIPHISNELHLHRYIYFFQFAKCNRNIAIRMFDFRSQSGKR